MGEALFGTGGQLDNVTADGTSTVPIYCTVPPRWDVGYEGIGKEEMRNNQLNQSSNADSNATGIQGLNNDKSYQSTTSLTLDTNPIPSINSNSDSDLVLRGERSKEGISEYEDVREILAAFVNIR